MESRFSDPIAGEEPIRVRLEELLADMQGVLSGLPAKRLDPARDQGLAELPTSGIFDMRAMANAYETEHSAFRASDGEDDELPVGGPIEILLTPSFESPRRETSSLVYLYAGALGVLLVALTAVATTILMRAG